MQGADHTWVKAGFLELSSFANLYVFFPDPVSKTLPHGQDTHKGYTS